MIAYFNGEYLPKDRVSISPDDRGFLLADAVYDVVRLYGGRLFRAEEHLRRLEDGARALRFQRASFEELPDVLRELVRRNDLRAADATIYIQVTRGAAARTHAFPPRDTPPTIYVVPSRFSQPREEQEAGLRAILVPDQRWARCDIKTVGLLANTLAHQQAREAGAQEAIFLRDQLAQEGTHSSLFIVSGGTVITPPLNNYVLPGITRRIVLGLCAEMSVPCHERPVRAADLLDADEVMVVGTTVEVSPVVEIDGRPVGGGAPGPVTRKLQAAFRALTGAPPA